jgi:acyl carrier protein
LHILAYTRDQWLRTKTDRIVRPRSVKKDPVPLDAADIANVIAEEFDVERESLSGGTRLVTDLGFDSIQLLEFVCIVEDRYGLELEMEQLQFIETIDDIYAQCQLVLNG